MRYLGVKLGQLPKFGALPTLAFLFVAGCGPRATTVAGQGLTRPSTQTTAIASAGAGTHASSTCPPRGAVTVNLGGENLAGNSSVVTGGLRVAQFVWVVYRPQRLLGEPKQTGPLAGGVTFPNATSSRILQATCHSATARSIGTAFRARAPGISDVFLQMKCYGCNDLGFTARLVVRH